MESLNVLDLVIIGLLGGGALWGYKVGCLRAIRPSVLIFALFTVVYIYPAWKEYFLRENIVSFFLIILLIFIGLIIWGFIARYFKAGIGSSSLGSIDGILGLLLGLILGAILGGFLVFILEKYGGAEAKNIVDSSSLGHSVLKFFHIIMSFIENCFPLPKKESWWKHIF